MDKSAAKDALIGIIGAMKELRLEKVDGYKKSKDKAPAMTIEEEKEDDDD